MRIKSIAVLLLVATLAGAGTVPTWLPPAQVLIPPSGCHGHGDNAPASRHDCCLVGHDVAVPKVFAVSCPAIECEQSEWVVRPAFPGALLGIESVPAPDSTFPQSSTPLRL